MGKGVNWVGSNQFSYSFIFMIHEKMLKKSKDTMHTRLSRAPITRWTYRGSIVRAPMPTVATCGSHQSQRVDPREKSVNQSILLIWFFQTITKREDGNPCNRKTNLPFFKVFSLTILEFLIFWVHLCFVLLFFKIESFIIWFEWFKVDFVNFYSSLILIRSKLI